MIDKKLLKDLLSTNTPNGNEREGIEVVKKYLEHDAKLEFIDKVGNIAFSVGNDNAETAVMVSAHIDEIGLKVQYIDDDGFIYFIKNGGVDPKVLLGSSVTIMCQNGNKITGVIGKAPIHVEYHTDNKDKVTKVSEMKIDCGFENKEEAIKYAGVSVGDDIVVNGSFIELGEHRFASKGCDDKVGVYVMCEVMKRLKKYSINNLKVYGVCCTQEETTASGAVSAAARINPQYSIDYDVTFATDDGLVEKKEWGDVKLGLGGCIVHSQDCNKSFVKLIKDSCNHNNIPYQEFALSGSMTNTTDIKQSSENCETALLSIPQRNMHTQVEVCDYRDLESLITMTVRTILNLDALVRV